MPPEHITGREEQEEDRLEAGSATGRKAEGGTAGAQHAEHGDALGVHSPGAELTEDGHEQERQEHCHDPGRVAGMGLIE